MGGWRLRFLELMEKWLEEIWERCGWVADAIGFLCVAKHYDKIAECHQ
jgi:hypothetical protein